ncbi:MAG: elongation factor P [Candidatus Spechtbacterales bacterium]
MLTINQLAKDDLILMDGQPYQILEINHKKIARQSATVQAKLKNLISGATVSRNLTNTDKFEEADVDKQELLFVYCHRGMCVLRDSKDKSKRFEVDEQKISDKKEFLKGDMKITAHFFRGDLINIELPIKADYKVIQAPPGIRGNTADGGTKKVKIETGAEISTPLFIEEGDTIRVNTQKGEYVERVAKGK